MSRSLLVDVTAIALVVAASVLAQRSGLLHGPPLAWSVLFAALSLVMLMLRGAYEKLLSVSLIDELSEIVAATVAAALVQVVLRLLIAPQVGMASQTGRMWTVVTAALLAGHVAMSVGRRFGWSSSRRKALIIGADHVGQLLAARLLARPELGLNPVGFLGASVEGEIGVDLPLLGENCELAEVARRYDVDTVVFSFATEPHAVLVSLARECRRLGLEVSLVPRLLEEMSGRVRIERLGGLTLLRVNQVDPNGWQFRAKYALDRVVAALLLGLSAPLLALIGLCVRCSSPGPVLFRQRRLSRDGRVFDMLKFRTMIGSPEADGEADSTWLAGILGDWPSTDRPVADRRTPIGPLLRALSLDELPQLINVLRGEMSLVGPRPERISPAQRFEESVYRYGDRYRVKPGITGWAQVHGLRGQTCLSDRTEWDNYYIENWSPALDLKILLMTVPALFAALRSGRRSAR